MIKIFRNIRNNLLSEGKTGSYIKYALGEIILVVIGILIALSINNWNEERIEKLKVHSLLKSMRDDLNLDTLSLYTFVINYEQQIKNCRELLNDSLYENINTDSLFSMLPLNQIPVVLNSQAFEKIKNASISNYLPDLEDTINTYYSLSADYFKAQIDWEHKMTDDNETFWFGTPQIEIPNIFSPFEVDLPYRQNESQRKQELTKVLNSMEGRKRIRMALYGKQLIIYAMQQRMKEAKNLIMLIQENLSM